MATVLPAAARADVLLEVEVELGDPGGLPLGPAERAECGPNDAPEPGPSGLVPLVDELSGRSREGYSCNLRWVGGSDLGGRGGDTQMTWYGDCAYRVVPDDGSGSDGIAVVDMADPARPRLVGVLRERAWVGQGGVLGIHEGVHASEASGLLVVPVGHLVTVYDVSADCRRPQLRSTLDTGVGANPAAAAGLTTGFHAGQLSPDGTWFYGTTAGFEGFVAPFGPCLTVVDLIDPTAPKVALRWGEDFPCHDLGFSAEGDRAYVGWYAPVLGHPAAVVGAFTPASPVTSALSGMAVLDTSRVHARTGPPTITELGRLTGGRQHTETAFESGGRRFVIGAEEAVCPGGTGRIVDVTDPATPVEVSTIALDVNRLTGCAASSLDADVGVNLLQYMTHYVSVDDPTDATLAFISWYSSGLRVFDIRDPAHPVEVAYFNPAIGAAPGRTHDSTTTYPRYVPETGQIWFGSAVNAVAVVELAPHLRPEVLRGQPASAWSQPATASANARGVADATVRAPATPLPVLCMLPVGPATG